jgi:membrane associated rhomboid family serine protease
MDRATEFFHRLYFTAPECWLAWPAAAMVAGTIFGLIAGKSAGRLGVVPRTLPGLVGILTAPFVHANVAHLAANLPPFVVLGALVLRRDETHFVLIAAAIALLQGALVWLLGRKAAHVGMSGVIFGFFGYLLASAWLTKSASDLLVAGGVLVFYGGMLAGLKPARDGTSWEGHGFGLLAGIAVAWLEMR